LTHQGEGEEKEKNQFHEAGFKDEFQDYNKSEFI